MLDFLKSPPPAIGIEIGTSSIKAVSLALGGKDQPPLLQKVAMVPTPMGSMTDGDVTNPHDVSQAIRSMLDGHGISGKHAVTAVANQAAVTRNIIIDRRDRKELETSIRWEAERYIPYPIDEVSIDFHILEESEEHSASDQMEVIIAAAPLEKIARLKEVLQAARLETTIVDLKCFAALRALRGSLLGTHVTKSTLSGHNQNYTENGEVALVIEIGANSSVINLVRGDRVLMARNINVSADDFTTALQKQFDLDFNAAEELKLGYATATTPTEDEEDLLNFDSNQGQYSPQNVFDVVRPVLGDMITEIRRSLEFYRVQSGDIVIDRTYLAGGGAKLRGLAAAIGDALGFRVELANPWLTVQSEQANVDAGYLQSNAPEFTVPLGLALRGLPGGNR